MKRYVIVRGMSNSPERVYHVKRLVPGSTGTNTINVVNPLTIVPTVESEEPAVLEPHFHAEPPVQLVTKIRHHNESGHHDTSAKGHDSELMEPVEKSPVLAAVLKVEKPLELKTTMLVEKPVALVSALNVEKMPVLKTAMPLDKPSLATSLKVEKPPELKTAVETPKSRRPNILISAEVPR